jgi:hypothetical protein
MRFVGSVKFSFGLVPDALLGIMLTPLFTRVLKTATSLSMLAFALTGRLFRSHSGSCLRDLPGSPCQRCNRALPEPTKEVPSAWSFHWRVSHRLPVRRRVATTIGLLPVHFSFRPAVVLPPLQTPRHGDAMGISF